jgi:hypothetical protein
LEKTSNPPLKTGDTFITTQKWSLEYFEIVMKQRQEGDDRQDDKAALEQVFQDMLPEKAEDDNGYNDTQYNEHSPNNLIVRDRGKVNRHSHLLNETTASY